MTQKEIRARIDQYFEKLVPAEGKAGTAAGEIVRAFCQIEYRFWNDGDQIGIGYGRETCNPAARLLAAKGGTLIDDFIFTHLWGNNDEEEYKEDLFTLGEMIIDLLDSNPELLTRENINDMWDFRDCREDVDDSWWDEDEEDDEMCI